MVFIKKKPGGLANSIWQTAFFIVNSIENNYKVYHLGFWYYPLFSEHFKINNKIVSFITNRWIKKALKVISPIFQNIDYYESMNSDNHYDLTSPDYIGKARKILFVEGWVFVDRRSLLKHKSHLQEIFTPNDFYLERIDNVLSGIHSDIKIGIHIRRTDYKTFNGGKWFYDVDVYREKMKEMVNLPELSNKAVTFIVCSDERFNELDFPGLNVVTGDRHFIEDLYLLSKTDYIIGPPSTYSMWASFYGSVPLLRLETSTTKISLSEFKVHEG